MLRIILRIFYDLLAFLSLSVYLCTKIKRLIKDKDFRKAIKERLSTVPNLNLPIGKPVYWFYAISVGETNVADILVKELRKQDPDASIVVSVATDTGFGNAKRRIKEADHIIRQRYDLSFLIYSMYAAIKPTSVIIVEGDLWLNMLSIAHETGVPVYLASAKISERSQKNYLKLPLLIKWMVSCLTYSYMQTSLYKQRFQQLGMQADDCEVYGNVKLDMEAPLVSDVEKLSLTELLGITGKKPIIVFGSLHPGEETYIVRAMEKLWDAHPQAHCIILPRHPERTKQITDSIYNLCGKPCDIYTEITEDVKKPGSQITIIDRIGLAMKFYSLCDIAVVCGSFIESVGGHNITEPSFYAKPVIYGPYVYKQLGLHDLMMEYQAGLQTEGSSLPDVLCELMNDREKTEFIGCNGQMMIDQSHGVASRIITDILNRSRYLFHTKKSAL